MARLAHLDYIQGLIRRAFLEGYECGRRDEREDRQLLSDLPDNVLPIDGRRSNKRKESSNA